MVPRTAVRTIYEGTTCGPNGQVQWNSMYTVDRDGNTRLNSQGVPCSWSRYSFFVMNMNLATKTQWVKLYMGETCGDNPSLFPLLPNATPTPTYRPSTVPAPSQPDTAPPSKVPVWLPSFHPGVNTLASEVPVWLPSFHPGVNTPASEVPVWFPSFHPGVNTPVSEVPVLFPSFQPGVTAPPDGVPN